MYTYKVLAGCEETIYGNGFFEAAFSAQHVSEAVLHCNISNMRHFSLVWPGFSQWTESPGHKLRFALSRFFKAVKRPFSPTHGLTRNDPCILGRDGAVTRTLLVGITRIGDVLAINMSGPGNIEADNMCNYFAPVLLNNGTELLLACTFKMLPAGGTLWVEEDEKTSLMRNFVGMPESCFRHVGNMLLGESSRRSLMPSMDSVLKNRRTDLRRPAGRREDGTLSVWKFEHPEILESRRIFLRFESRDNGVRFIRLELAEYDDASLLVPAELRRCRTIGGEELCVLAFPAKVSNKVVTDYDQMSRKDKNLLLRPLGDGQYAEFPNPHFVQRPRATASAQIVVGSESGGVDGAGFAQASTDAVLEGVRSDSELSGNGLVGNAGDSSTDRDGAPLSHIMLEFDEKMEAIGATPGDMCSKKESHLERGMLQVAEDKDRETAEDVESALHMLVHRSDSPGAQSGSSTSSGRTTTSIDDVLRFQNGLGSFGHAPLLSECSGGNLPCTSVREQKFDSFKLGAEHDNDGMVPLGASRVAPEWKHVFASGSSSVVPMDTLPSRDDMTSGSETVVDDGPGKASGAALKLRFRTNPDADLLSTHSSNSTVVPPEDLDCTVPTEGSPKASSAGWPPALNSFLDSSTSTAVPPSDDDEDFMTSMMSEFNSMMSEAVPFDEVFTDV